MSNLTPTIKSIQDVMRQDSGVDGMAMARTMGSKEVE